MERDRHPTFTRDLGKNVNVNGLNPFQYLRYLFERLPNAAVQ